MCCSDGELSVVRSLADALADEIKEANARLEAIVGSVDGGAKTELSLAIDDLDSIAVRVRMLGI